MAKMRKAWYAKCSKQELVRFVKDRTGGDAEPKQVKSLLVERLVEIDRDPPGVFDFLGLAQELKDLVYDELFVDQWKSGRPVHTAIMRTCKQLYLELVSKINEGSHAVVFITTNPRYCRYGATLQLPHCGRYSKICLNSSKSGELSFLRFRRVENITLKWQYTHRMWRKDPEHFKIEDVARVWPILIRDCEDLCSLKIIINDRRQDKDVERETLLGLLAPLKDIMKLHQVNVTIQGLDKITRDDFEQACCSRARAITRSDQGTCGCSDAVKSLQ